MMELNSILNDVTGIVADVKPYMFEPDSNANAASTNAAQGGASASSTDDFLTSADDEPDEEEHGKTDPELDGYIGQWVKELEAAKAEGDKEAANCACTL